MDWTGNKKSTFVCLGASNHTNHERAQFDYYATDPKAAEILLKVEPSLCNIWECACGEGHLAKVFDRYGLLGRATDLIDRGYGTQAEFMSQMDKWGGDIVTNPPYKWATEFVRKALELVPDGRKVCMFLKLTFLESKKRKVLFAEYPLQRLYVLSSRIACAMNGKFDKDRVGAIAYGWYVWEKGYKGDSVIKWV